jgi:uncharacterized protein YcgL (UPF0745 family)
MKTDQFDKIRPYNNDEVPAALQRMMAHPHFQMALDYLFEKEKQALILEELRKVKGNLDFQKAFMYRAINRILEKSSDGLSVENEQMLREIGSCVFVSNHRDILLDSAILQVLLVDLELETSEITFGSNLMVSDFIIDFGKVNRMFIVYRDGSPREMLENSKRLSDYILYTIEQKKLSIWIAQRKGRTKNGLDMTDSAVLKMLTTFDRKSPVEAFKRLNIVPTSISYEFEPCELLKIRELYYLDRGGYTKAPGEDIQSVLMGITQPKGRIHLAFGTPVNEFLEENSNHLNAYNIHQKVAEYIDNQVYKLFKLFPANYWAFDKLTKSGQYSHLYSIETEMLMTRRLEALYSFMGFENQELENLFLGIYANPVIAKLQELKD